MSPGIVRSVIASSFRAAGPVTTNPLHPTGGWRRLLASGAAPAAPPAPPEAAEGGRFRRDCRVEGTTIVSTPEAAERALRELYRLKARPHAWDTETIGCVMNSTKRSQTPVRHGQVICATCYCGEDADFGDGPKLFLDNAGPSSGLLELFKGYFEDEECQKVFHNYSFERHMLKRHGITLRGFHADTLHLARLIDTSLSSWEGAVQSRLMGAQAQASLHGAERRSAAAAAAAAQAAQAQPAAAAPPPPRRGSQVVSVSLGRMQLDRRLWESSSFHTAAYLPDLAAERAEKAKKAPAASLGYSLKSLARHFDLADGGGDLGSFGKLFGVHSTAALEAHNSPERFKDWVDYATQDAVLTHRLFHKLQVDLDGWPWQSQVHQRPVKDVLMDPKVLSELVGDGPSTYQSAQYSTGLSMWNFHQIYMRDFAECLADMEERGVGVDIGAGGEMEARAEQDLKAQQQAFIECIGAVRMPNGKQLCSDAASINVSSAVQLQHLLFDESTGDCEGEAQLDALKAFGSGKDRFDMGSLRLMASKKKKERTAKGIPSTASAIVEKLVGDIDNPLEGPAYKQLLQRGYDQPNAELAARGLWHLAKSKKARSLLNGFIRPLIEFGGTTGRIHPAWKFDTSTGRLACRTPNLQNLPSSGRDLYGIRDVLRPAEGKLFVVADYSQLELRVLAHVSGCPGMIRKLSAGGDFHSEVAAEMFPYIAEAVSRGEVTMDDSDGGKPSVKKKFGRERSQAKAVNFGIIYGLGATSLAEDLGVSVADSEDLMARWFKSKPAVKKWLTSVQRDSSSSQRTLSMLGRSRYLPFIISDAPFVYKQRSVRAAKNFAIQGSAADIMLAAMLRLWKDPKLLGLGYHIVMQIHDEFVLEGPREAAAEAKARVREIMCEPFARQSPGFKFSVPLLVDVEVQRSYAEREPGY